MRIGRLEFGKAIGVKHWGHMQSVCGCDIWDFGMYYVCWGSKYCKCQACGQYQCSCEEDFNEDT